METETFDNDKLERREKRSSSLTKLSRNLNNFALITANTAQKCATTTLLELKECSALALTLNADQLLNVACTMVQEPDEDLHSRPQRKFDAVRIYSFESKFDTKKTVPGQISSPIARGLDEEPKQAVVVSIGSSEKFCRFCFEAEESAETGKLVCPCRCDGSLKHIHETCLKTWIVQQNSEDRFAEGSRCEICSYSYHLEFTRKLKLSCSRAFDQGFSHLLISVGMAVCLGNLIWLVCKYTRYTLNQQASQALLSIFALLALVFLVSMIFTLKKACFEMRVTALKIHDFDPNYHQHSGSVQIQVHDVINHILSSETLYSSESSQHEAMPEMRSVRQRPENPSLNQSLNTSLQQLIGLSVSNVA